MPMWLIELYLLLMAWGAGLGNAGTAPPGTGFIENGNLPCGSLNADVYVYCAPSGN